MKLSLIAIAVTLLAAACGGGDEAPPPAPPAPAPAPTTPIDPLAAKRTLVDAPAMATKGDNLVMDPSFASLGGMYAATLFVNDVDARVETPATSPAGPAQPVLLAKANGMQPSVVLAAQGGLGTFDARIWVSVEEGARDPSIMLATLDGGAYPFAAAKGTTQKHGERTYQLFTAHVSEPLVGKVYLLVEPSGSSVTAISAPSLAPATGMQKRSLATGEGRVRLDAARARLVADVASRRPSPPLTGARWSPLAHL